MRIKNISDVISEFIELNIKNILRSRENDMPNLEKLKQHASVVRLCDVIFLHDTLESLKHQEYEFLKMLDE